LERTQSFLPKYRRYAGAAARPATEVASGQRVSEISYHWVDGAKSKGPSMSIKFEGKPPFYLGIAELASAHALDGVLRATISVPVDVRGQRFYR
jgi:hypothetical protein